MLEGTNVCVVGLETRQRPDDCRHCGRPGHAHGDHRSAQSCPQDAAHPWTCYERIGWDDHAALGLSHGCYCDYQTGQTYWFEPSTLEGTIHYWVLRQPLLVSFNGLGLHFPLLQTVLTHAEWMDSEADRETWHLAERFATLCATSYDILATIWEVDPASRFIRGRNTLAALARANGLGPDAMDGPMDCQQEMLRTQGLFERILAGEPLRRGDSSALHLPHPTLLPAEG
jgi:hypothetical protein